MQLNKISWVAGALAMLSTSVLAGPNATAGKWTYLNPADPTDFCLMLPPTKGMGIGASEGQAVSYCTNPSDAPGARQFDSAAVLLAHQVVDYKNNWIQMTGYLDNNILQIDPTPGSGGQYDDAPWGVEPTSGCLGYTRYIELVGVIPNTTRAEFCIRCCMIPNITDAFDHSVDNPCFAGHDTLGCDVDIPGDYSSPGITLVVIDSSGNVQTNKTFNLPSNSSAASSSSAAPSKTATTSAAASSSSAAATSSPTASAATRSWSFSTMAVSLLFGAVGALAL